MWNILVKIGFIFPKDRGENKKIFETTTYQHPPMGGV